MPRRRCDSCRSRSKAPVSVEPDEPDEEDEDKGYTGYYGVDWREVRADILERDGYTCRATDCDVTDEEHRVRDDLFPPGGGLHIHHVEKARMAETYEEANDRDNLVSLCSEHHRKAEWHDGVF